MFGFRSPAPITINIETMTIYCLPRQETPANEELLGAILKGIKDMATDLTELQGAVEENTSIDQSAITLIEGLADQIESLQTDPAALAALASQLRASSVAMAAAVAANTPAAPADPPVDPDA